MQRIASALFGLILLGLSLPARAELGRQGDAVFSAERLFGIRGERTHWDRPAPAEDLEWNQTVISFGIGDTMVPYNVPRLAFDYLVIDKFSVGGAIGFVTSDNDPEGGTSANTNAFLLSPRVGFLHMFGRVAGIWPRAGLTYHRISREYDSKESGLGLNLELQFPIVFTEHFGMLVGLGFDQSLFANRDPDNSVDFSISYRSFGLHIGLFGWI
jgi:hypothetical protein